MDPCEQPRTSRAAEALSLPLHKLHAGSPATPATSLLLCSSIFGNRVNNPLAPRERLRSLSAGTSARSYFHGPSLVFCHGYLQPFSPRICVSRCYATRERPLRKLVEGFKTYDSLVHRVGHDAACFVSSGHRPWRSSAKSGAELIAALVCVHRSAAQPFCPQSAVMEDINHKQVTVCDAPMQVHSGRRICPPCC